MRSPLIQTLIDKHQYPLLTIENAYEFIDSHEHVVLFFTENPKQFPESNDVAVILPELMSAFHDRLAVAVVDEKAEKKLQQQYMFSKWPALVFLRKGEYMGAITGMQNWSDYQAEFERLLSDENQPLPQNQLPVITDSSGGCH